MTLWKVLSENGRSYNGGDAQWHLPRGKRPGEWMPVVADLKPCKRGYHLCRRADLLRWIGPVIWEAEGRGASVECDDKIVFAQARLIRRVDAWDERAARMFAADCAAHVLPIFEAAYPGDDRPRAAIAAARAYARGELDAAARAAARDAAIYAAGSATGDAAWDAAMSAALAASDAARSAAWDASRSAALAARSAAWDAAMSAASDAVRSATGGAARDAAIYAAGSATGDAAMCAAWGAATAAEVAWQTGRLHAVLGGER